MECKYAISGFEYTNIMSSPEFAGRNNEILIIVWHSDLYTGSRWTFISYI